MRNFKETLRKILFALLEHVPLVATILASVFILTDSQIRSYSMETLLLWIISLLGLIATYYSSTFITPAVWAISYYEKRKKREKIARK